MLIKLKGRIEFKQCLFCYSKQRISSDVLNAYLFRLLRVFIDVVRRACYVPSKHRMISKLVGFGSERLRPNLRLYPHTWAKEAKTHTISVVIVGFRHSFESGPFRLLCSSFFTDIQHAPLQSNTTCFYVKFSQYSYLSRRSHPVVW